MPQRTLLTVAFVTLSACATYPPYPPCPEIPECSTQTEAEPQLNRWFVIHVTDGDTLKARLETSNTERTETIRLLNLDTPERNEPDFVEATEALKTLVRKGYVELEFEKPNIEKRDGFGRLLAYVIADGVNVNIEMVRQGWSKFYTKYGEGRLEMEFEAVEREAKEKQRGLWSNNGFKTGGEK